MKMLEQEVLDRDEWLRRFERALERKQQALETAFSTAASLLHFLEFARDEIESADAELDRLREERGEPNVLVRQSPGPRPEIFHNAPRPCRRVRSGDRAANFRLLPLGQALSRGLRPCSACAAHLDEEFLERS